MTKKIIAVAGLCAASLTACAPPPPPMVWVRADGQRIGGHPALEQKVELDKTICNGETQKANMSAVPVYTTGVLSAIAIQQQRQGMANDIGKGCMAEKGYVYVPASVAEEKSAEFAAANRPSQKAAR